MKKYICEFIGTAVLVLFGCGCAEIWGSGFEVLGVAIAFGLAIVAMAYAIGHISGCHVNPAVSLAMLISKKISFKDFIGYVIAQVLGAFAGVGILYAIFSSCEGVKVAELSFGVNGYGDLSMLNISLVGALIVEAVLTFVFVYTILGVTSDEKHSSIAGVVIGLTLMFVHILGIPFTGTSVNPARSLAPAAVVGGEALSQVWVFLLAPLVGAALAAFTFKYLNKAEK